MYRCFVILSISLLCREIFELGFIFLVFVDHFLSVFISNSCDFFEFFIVEKSFDIEPEVELALIFELTLELEVTIYALIEIPQLKDQVMGFRQTFICLDLYPFQKVLHVVLVTTQNFLKLVLLLKSRYFYVEIFNFLGEWPKADGVHINLLTAHIIEDLVELEIVMVQKRQFEEGLMLC